MHKADGIKLVTLICFETFSALVVKAYLKGAKKRKIEEEKTFPKCSSFYEVSIILTPKPDKDITRKENYRLICFMNIDEKISTKY